MEEKKLNLFSICHSQATHECPQKMSAHSVRYAGYREHIYTNVLFYYIDKMILIMIFINKFSKMIFFSN